MNHGESTTRSFPGLLPPSAPRKESAGSKAGSASGGSWWHSRAGLTPAERQLAHVQQAVIFTMLALALLIAVRLWFVDGLLRVVRIEGPSMANAFEGAHYRVTCDDCRFPFHCDAHDVPGNGLVVCPNCGYRENKLERATLQAGERVLIDRWRRLWNAPRRGDVVAARAPGASGDVRGDAPENLMIKRVAALPGERLSIRDGDLYADDQIVRKTPAEWRALRVLVHDNHYQPAKTKDLPARWQAGTAESGWAVEGTGFRYAIQKDTDLSWAACQLAFVPWRCSLAGSRTEIVSILDNDSYNQALTRSLQTVPDMGISCKLRVDHGLVAIVLDDGRDVFRLVLDPQEKKATLAIGEQRVAEAPLPIRFDQRPVEVEAAICDRQVFLLVGRQTIFRHPFERRSSKERATDGYEACQPVVIAASQSAQILLTDLRVWRDIYYAHPLELDRPWQADERLPAGQFALLGDNPPVSIDSRSGPSPGIERQAILGRVLRPFWNSR